MKAKVTVRFDEPITTLGGLRAALDQFVDDHPNPSDDSEPREIRVHVTPTGKVKSIEVLS